jgi:protease-4
LPESAIARREGLSVDRVRQLADGRVFTGQQALEVGLVDELGGYDEAVANLRTWIGSPDIPVSSDLQGFDRFWKILQSRFSLPPLPAGAAGGIENLVRSNSATDATLAGANLLGLPLWLSPPLQLQAELHL